MTTAAIEVERPQRWDHPLSAAMQAEDVQWLLRQAPFANMDAERFARTTPLADILRNDTRLVHFAPGDVIFREGQYGGTAFLVLSGSVRVFLTKLFASQGSSASASSRWRWLASTLGWQKSTAAGGEGRDAKSARRRDRDSRPTPQPLAAEHLGQRGSGSETRIFLQDVPRVLSEHATAAVTSGELFGELAAVTRAPREYTAVAEAESIVLEIRWQGLKLLKQDPAFSQLLDERYRNEVLQSHLRETLLFRFVPADSLQRVVEATRLESFGQLEWYASYRRQLDQPVAQRIAAEPQIASEGDYAAGLWIVRAGFARLSRRQGAGHRTLAYLGKGQLFGLRELAHNFRFPQQPPLPFQESLRAIGYVDALCIPKQTIFEHVLPYVRQADLPAPIDSPRYQFGLPVVDAPLEAQEHQVETGLLEFLVDQRLMNGRQAMVIDLERCTRCDDCVRACAATHGGTPVFERHGPQYDRWQFPQACMHCEDPVCMIGCPTGAIHRDHDTGLVQINQATCIGCKTCAESCPYEAIRMQYSRDGQGRAKVASDTGLPILHASKCDMCTSQRGGPACQAACPHSALVRLDLSDLPQIRLWNSGEPT